MISGTNTIEGGVHEIQKIGFHTEVITNQHGSECQEDMREWLATGHPPSAAEEKSEGEDY